MKIFVIGSARLDAYRQVGDSLAGRFLTHHLMPFSLKELQGAKYEADAKRLIERGGFPEPFLKEDDNDAKRWRNQYIDGLIRYDILDFERIHDFKAIQLVFQLLRHKVGSPISYKTISEDVGISPVTAKKYISILEALYIIFSVTPHSQNIARSLLKEPKIYFFDTGLVSGDNGKKFENMTAHCILKNIYALTDYEGDRWELKYLRTKEGKEVGFCVTKNNIIQELIETKYSDGNLSNNLRFFCNKYNLKGKQVVFDLKRERELENIKIIDAKHYLESLYM
ncbi:MAG: DUF4143 domain-containing protein [Elusimicrobiota bacterium]